MRRASYAQGVDGTAQAPRSRAERRELATADTRAAILAAARDCLLRDGFANLSTRNVAEEAGVPLSQIHYHFGSKRQLILAVLDAENARLLERQRAMFDASWYSTPMLRRSSGVRPEGVKWKMNSWQSFRKRGLLIGL